MGRQGEDSSHVSYRHLPHFYSSESIPSPVAIFLPRKSPCFVNGGRRHRSGVPASCSAPPLAHSSRFHERLQQPPSTPFRPLLPRGPRRLRYVSSLFSNKINKKSHPPLPVSYSPVHSLPPRLLPPPKSRLALPPVGQFLLP